MFGLLFLLISGIFATEPTKVTLKVKDNTETACTDAAESECPTLTLALAKLLEPETALTEITMTDNDEFTFASFAVTAAITQEVALSASTAPTLTLSGAPLTIGSDSAEGKVSFTKLNVEVAADAAQFANVVKGSLSLTDFVVTIATSYTTCAITQSLLQVAKEAELTIAATSSFTGVIGKVNGPCINIDLAAGAKMSVTATFTGCQSTATTDGKSDGYGGAIYMTIAGAPSSTDGEWVFAPSFAAGTSAMRSNAASAVKGKYLYVYATADVFDAAIWGDALGTDAGDCIIEYGDLSVDLLEASKIYLDASKDGGVACGGSDAACASIADAKTNAADYTAGFTGFILAANHTEAATTLDKNMYINGNGKTWEMPNSVATQFTTSTYTLTLNNVKFSYTNDSEVEAKTTATVFANVAGGALTMHGCTFSMGADGWTLTNAVISLGTGELSLYGCTFSALSLSAKPVIEAADMNKMTFYKAGNNTNKFENINRVGGATGGAVFQLTAATTLSLDNIEITGCTSVKAEAETDNPSADAIYMVPSSAPSLSFDGFTFTAPASSTAAAKFIFINATSAANLPTYQSLASFFWGSSTTGLIVRAKIGDETANVDMSTAGITIAMGTHATTDSATNCGAPYTEGTETKTVPCATLAEVAGSSFWTGKNYKALTIASGLAVQAAGLSIDGYLAISGAGPMTFKLASGALFTLSANAYEVDVNGCTFTYNDGTADTTNADPVEISTPVFKLSGANNVLILTGVTIGVDETKNNLVLTTEAISYTAGTVTIDGCTFENLNRKDDCLVSPLPAADAFVMKNTNTFKTIAITGYGNGAAMATTLTDAAHAVVITGATFESCTAVGNAGALAVIITAGSLTVSKCTFTNCGATKSSKADESFSGYGGAMGIIISSGTPSFTFSELSFSGCTAGTAGSVLAVTCPEDYMKTAYPSFAEFIKLGRTANVAVYGTIAEDGTLTPNDLYKLIPETAKVDATNGEDGKTCGEVDEEASKKACKSFAGALATYYKLVTKIEMTKEKYTEETAAQWSLAQTMSIKGTAGETATDRTSITLKNYLANMADTPYVFYIGNNLNTMTISIADITINVVSNYDAETNLELFYVSTGATLELNNVGIANDTTSKKIQTVPVIDATNGKVSLTSVTFDKFYMKEVSLLNIPADHFSTFTLCNFNGITKESGAGSVLNLAIVDGMNFNLAENNFTSCKTLNGNGGAVYINYNKGNLTIGNQEFNQTKKNCTTLFKSCSAGAPAENDDTNADAPTAGAGGAIYLNLEAVDEEKYLLNITSILIEDCTAAKGGNAMYAHATTEEGTKLLENKNFWSVLTKINGNKKDEFTIMDNEGNEEKPKGSSSGFPIWAIIVIVVVVVVVIVIVVVIIVCCCCRSSS